MQGVEIMTIKNTILYLAIIAANVLGVSLNAENHKLNATIVMSQEEAEKLQAWIDNNKKMLKDNHTDAEKLYMLSSIRARNTKEYKAMEKCREEQSALVDALSNYKELCAQDTALLKRFFNKDCQQVSRLNTQIDQKYIQEEQLLYQALTTREYNDMLKGMLSINLSDTK